MFKYSCSSLSNFQFPNLSEDIDKLLSQHVETLAAGSDDPDLEREIDTIIFDVYGLSASERKLVLDWLGERREALGGEMPPDWRKVNALRAAAGAWRDSIDGEQLKREIRTSRDIRTRPVTTVLTLLL